MSCMLAVYSIFTFLEADDGLRGSTHGPVTVLSRGMFLTCVEPRLRSETVL